MVFTFATFAPEEKATMKLVLKYRPIKSLLLSCTEYHVFLEAFVFMPEVIKLLLFFSVYNQFKQNNTIFSYICIYEIKI